MLTILLIAIFVNAVLCVGVGYYCGKAKYQTSRLNKSEADADYWRSNYQLLAKETRADADYERKVWTNRAQTKDGNIHVFDDRYLLESRPPAAVAQASKKDQNSAPELELKTPYADRREQWRKQDADKSRVGELPADTPENLKLTFETTDYIVPAN